MTRWHRLDAQRLLLLVFLGVIFAVAARPLIDTDLWWHLANGRYIAGRGVPSTDVYSFTAVGHIWVVHEWLADLLFYRLYQLAGLPGLMILAGAVVAATQYLVYRLLRRGGLGTTSAVLLGLILALASSPSWGPRPQLLNPLLTGGLVLLLLRYRSHPGRWIWALLAYFALWANLHSGYTIGVAAMLLFAAAELAAAHWQWAARMRPGNLRPLSRPQLRRVATVGLLGFLCGLLTPAGYRTLIFALGTLGSSKIQDFIVEWGSPDFHSLPGRLLMVVILVLVAGSLGTGRQANGPDLTYLVWGLAGLALALTSQRHVPIFAVLGGPLLGYAAATLLAGIGLGPRRLSPPSRSTATMNLAVLMLLIALGGIYVGGNLSQRAVDRAVASVEPVGATDYLLAGHPPHELFNFYSYGGYLIWKAYPEYRVFIDGRIEVYGDRLFDEYLTTEHLTPRWQEPLDRHGVATVMIPVGDPLQPLLESKGWRQVYGDQVARVLTRG